MYYIQQPDKDMILTNSFLSACTSRRYRFNCGRWNLTIAIRLRVVLVFSGPYRLSQTSRRASHRALRHRNILSILFLKTVQAMVKAPHPMYWSQLHKLLLWLYKRAFRGHLLYIIGRLQLASLICHMAPSTGYRHIYIHM